MPSALISYSELRNLLDQDNEDLVVLDATFVLPNSPVDPYTFFQNKRIGDAQYFDVHDIADKTNPLPHMLPNEETFSKSASALGISNKSQIVIYGQTGLALGAARAWWMFRIFGHLDVRILDGSLLDWENNGYPVATEPSSVPAPSTFVAKFNPDLVVSIDQVAEASEKNSTLILDARPPDRFSGTQTEPRQGMRSGHIPNSLNITTGSLINPSTGGLKAKDDLERVIPKDILNSASTAIMTCGSGVTACVIALAFHELGNQNWSIYDGSWSEWGQSSYPVA